MSQNDYKYCKVCKRQTKTEVVGLLSEICTRCLADVKLTYDEDSVSYKRARKKDRLEQLAEWAFVVLVMVLISFIFIIL